MEQPNLSVISYEGVFRRCVIITSQINFFSPSETCFHQFTVCQESLHPTVQRFIATSPLFFSWFCFYCWLFCLTLFDFASLCLCASSRHCTKVSPLFPWIYLSCFLFSSPALHSAHSAGTLLASLLCSLHLGGGWRRKDATSPLVKLDGAINSPEVWLAARWLQPSFHSANGSGGGERAGLGGGGGGAVNENQTLEVKWPMFRGNEAHVGGGPFYAH